MQGRLINNAKYITKKTFWSFILFISFLGTLFFFKIVDVYHSHFFSHGWLISAYQIIRLFFALSLLWIYFSVGLFFSFYILKMCKISSLQANIAVFLLGLSITEIILFIMGLLGFYNYFLLTGLASSIFLMSLPMLGAKLKSLHHSLVSLTRNNVIGLSLLVILFIFLVVSKGLYPAGGHDYYTHYFYFYNSVIQTGKISFNEVWYHFYYSKGLALVFFAMIMSDPLAPQLVTIGLIFFSVFIIFNLLRQQIYSFLPWIGASLYVIFLIYTPGPIESFRNGGWGDLEKVHEIAAVLLLSIIWLTTKLYAENNKLLYGFALILTLCSTVIISLAASIIGCIYVSSIIILYLWQEKFRAAFWGGLAITIAAISIISILAINYVMTGLPNDQGLFTFWPYLNFEKIKSLGFTSELLMVHWLKTILVANQETISLPLLWNILSYLRVDVWGFLLICTLPILLINLFKRQKPKGAVILREINIWACFLFLLSVLFVSVFLGRDQVISFYRFTSFSYGPMLCFSLLLLALVYEKQIKWTIWFVMVGLFSFGFSACWLLFSGQISAQKIEQTNLQIKDSVTQIMRNSAHLMMGRISLFEGYQNQQGWPGRLPWGGIYPPMLNVWKVLPKKTRIWSMHIHSYCMLPDCNVQTYISFKFSPSAGVIYYGNPDNAKAILQHEGLNYFFISNSLDIRDPLSKSPLFTPDNIGRYFGQIWSDGDSTLLTWKENAIYPISENWLIGYKKNISASNMISSFPYAELRQVLREADTSPNSIIIESNIPWYHAGWYS